MVLFRSIPEMHARLYGISYLTRLKSRTAIFALVYLIEPAFVRLVWLFSGDFFVFLIWLDDTIVLVCLLSCLGS